MKKPVLEILNNNTGKPTDGWVLRANEEGTARVQFIKDAPEDEVVYEWIATPEGCVEWTDITYNWMHSFKVKADGEFFVRAFDTNGFHHDAEPVFVKLSTG